MHNSSSVPKAASLLTVSQFSRKEYWGQDPLKGQEGTIIPYYYIIYYIIIRKVQINLHTIQWF